MIVIPEFNEVSKLKSVLSNFLLLDENWKNLRKFLEALMGNLSELLDESIIEQITENIINQIQSFKSKIPFVYTYDVGYEVIVGKYKITKLSTQSLSVEMIDVPDWNTENLIIQVSTEDGEVLYPVITKTEGMFTVEFTEDFYTDLIILFI